VIDTEVMTDNLILSVEGRQSNASGFDFSVPNSSHFDYYIGAYRAAEAASRVINSIDIILLMQLEIMRGSSSLY
jgi:hypothetical protein